MNAVLKKLVYKGQSPVLLLEAPEEFKTVSGGFEGAVDTKPAAKQQYAFALAFVRSLAEGEKLGKAIGKSLAPEAVFWMAYPKQTSRKYPKADINRDSARELLAQHGLEAVSMVAVDEDWSALRFKQAAAK